ncbi:MAG: DUF3307 domain-containing protein [Bacteroidota bacterium]
MNTALIWFIKLILSHLLTDFILQPTSWIKARYSRHFLSLHLYLHAFITALVVWCMLGFQYHWVVIVIFITHLCIDGWKSYQKPTVQYFIIDQVLHFLVIVACWYFTFFNLGSLLAILQPYYENVEVWKIVTGFVFITTPAAIFIGKFTCQWRDKIEFAENLANAGKWIGIAERIIVLIFILYAQYAAIGLLVAAKALIRFNEKDRQEIKTEYLVVGTLLSLAIAVVVGVLIKL